MAFLVDTSVLGRIVAVCRVHGITHLLTFNIGHFTRLTSFEPGLAVIYPSTV